MARIQYFNPKENSQQVAHNSKQSIQYSSERHLDHARTPLHSESCRSSLSLNIVVPRLIEHLPSLFLTAASG